MPLSLVTLPHVREGVNEGEQEDFGIAQNPGFPNDLGLGATVGVER